MDHHFDIGARAPGLAAPDRARQDHVVLAPLGAAAAAAAAGVGPPPSDDASTGCNGRGARGDETADSCDCAQSGAVAQVLNQHDVATTKLIVDAVARAALLGIEAHRLAGGGYLLRHARGATIGIVGGDDALAAAMSGFEAAHNDVRLLVQRMRGAA